MTKNFFKIIILTFLILCTRFTYSEERVTGFLSISSTPAGATIYINGELIGETPKIKC